MRASLALAALFVICQGCGPKRPARYVIERDVATYHYRRYQKVLDVELPMRENPAVGHLATYVHSGQPAQVVPVFVTAYERARGLGETVRKQLRDMDDYTLGVRRLAREHLWEMRGESGDVWLLWVSGAQLVKIGAPEGHPRVPDDVVEAYLELYPSDLNRKGQVKRGADSAGPAQALEPSFAHRERVAEAR